MSGEHGHAEHDHTCLKALAVGDVVCHARPRLGQSLERLESWPSSGLIRVTVDLRTDPGTRMPVEVWPYCLSGLRRRLSARSSGAN